MSNVIELAVRLGHLRAALAINPQAARTLEDTIGPPIKAAILDVATAAFGGDLKPFKDKTVKAGVGYDVQHNADGWSIIFKLRPKGVWVMGQYGAGAHDIRPRRPRGRLHNSDEGYTQGPVHHPGTKGKRAIDGAYKAVRRHQTELVDAGIDKVIKEAWNG